LTITVLSKILAMMGEDAFLYQLKWSSIWFHIDISQNGTTYNIWFNEKNGSKQIE